LGRIEGSVRAALNLGMVGAGGAAAYGPRLELLLGELDQLAQRFSGALSGDDFLRQSLGEIRQRVFLEQEALRAAEEFATKLEQRLQRGTLSSQEMQSWEADWTALRAKFLQFFVRNSAMDERIDGLIRRSKVGPVEVRAEPPAPPRKPVAPKRLF
jgi:hypothetical protein